MIRRPLEVLLVVLIAGCGQSPSIASTAPSGPIATPPRASAQPSTRVDPTPTPIPSAVAAGRDFEWSPLPGLDLRGAYVATGASDGSASVLLGADTKTGALIAWTSTDGAHWARHWLDGATFGGGTPQGVIAGRAGFVAPGWTVGADLQVTPALWTSPNGFDWSMDTDPSSRFDVDPTEIAASGSSIVMSTFGTGSARALMTSPDGIAWIDVTPGDARRNAYLHLAATTTGYLAIAALDLGTGDGSTSLAAWRSTDGLAWTRDPVLERGLTRVSGVNAVLSSNDRFTVVDDSNGFEVVDDHDSLVRIDQPTASGGPLGGAAALAWLGARDDRGCLAAWIMSSTTWRSVAAQPDACVTESFMTRRIAVSDGWLIVAAGPTPSDETVWAIRPTGTVASVGSPGGPTPTPPTTAIPALPTGALTAKVPCPGSAPSIGDIVNLTPYDRAACFGSRALTFRAWVIDPGEGYGGTCEELTPRWLLDCVLPDWLLAEDRGSTETLHALRRPDASGDLKGVGRWVTVTGHFDDPAAATCRLPAGEARVGTQPTATYVLRCREQFAVTRIVTTR